MQGAVLEPRVEALVALGGELAFVVEGPIDRQPALSHCGQGGGAVSTLGCITVCTVESKVLAASLQGLWSGHESSKRTTT